MLDREELATRIIPALLENPLDISTYGPAAPEEPQPHGGALKQRPATALAATLQELVDALRIADPQRAAKKTSWYQRFIGVQLERQVMFEVAKTNVEQLLERATADAGAARRTVQQLQQELECSRQVDADLESYIRAGQEYLAAHPDAGRGMPEEIGLQPPRQRFAQRLVNLSTLLTANRIARGQEKLAIAQAIDLLDRYSQVVTVLVPMWRQHGLASDGATRDSAAVKAAIEAHQRLVRGLSDSLLHSTAIKTA